MAEGYGTVVQQENDILHHRLQGLYAKKGVQVRGISEGVWDKRRHDYRRRRIGMPIPNG